MSSFANIITAITYLVTLATALPTLEGRTTSPCPAAGKTARVWSSGLYTIFPDAPKLKSPPNNDLHVQYNKESGLTIKQVAAFGQFPRGAKNCVFGWAQDDAKFGTLVVGGDGHLSVRQLGGFPRFPAGGENGISAKDVEKFDSTKVHKESSPDFSTWDKELKETAHTAKSNLTCETDMYLMIEKSTGTSGNVYMKKTRKSGVYIEYSC